MMPSETLTTLKALAPMLARRDVTGLSVFDSQVTGKARPDSDIDVIVDHDPASRFSLLDLVAVGRIIEERLGIKADVITRPGLHPLLKGNIAAYGEALNALARDLFTRGGPACSTICTIRFSSVIRHWTRRLFPISALS